MERRTFCSQLAAGMVLLCCGPPRGANGHTLSTPSQVRAATASGFHLTARPWQASNTVQGGDSTPKNVKNEILTVLDGVCRFSAQHQAPTGAIIDPYLIREHQYATPYFAYGVGTLLASEKSPDLLDAGVRAMDHATQSFAGGNAHIPDEHGEFFIAPLAGALQLYEGRVAHEVLEEWRSRLQLPVEQVILSIQQRTNNWRTYAMKGEWLRYSVGLVDREVAVAFIEDGWTNRTQRERIVLDAANLYQDWNGHPQSHAVEAVGRGNLLALVLAGYDGPSAGEIWDAVLRGTEVSLLLQDPSGQCPPNGRTDNHVFNDVLYQLIFEAMAEYWYAEGDSWRAGQYRRAATLAFQSIERWRRHDGVWSGSYYITKNFFDPAGRVGYQPASQYSNYTGAVTYHLAEAFHARRSDIEERPAPTEIGGYALATDERFGSVVANAGGMHVFANLRGDSVPKYNTFWTPLGIVRFARAGWDSRLGPSDGARDASTGDGVTFGPTWRTAAGWVRLCDMAEHYHGTLRVDAVHPLFVKCSLLYAPVTGVGGPNFFLDLTITPDMVLATLHSPHEVSFGLTLPLVENDGRALDVTIANRRASLSYPEALSNGDEQHFLVLNEDAEFEEGEPVRSTYGWLRPVRVTTSARKLDVMVYPRSSGDPDAENVHRSIRLSDEGFESILARFRGSQYIGRYAAGGYGDRIDINKARDWDVVFSEACGFFLQLDRGLIVALEADRAVAANLYGQELALRPYEPLRM